VTKPLAVDTIRELLGRARAVRGSTAHIG
jgi:hypothetical protein